MKRIIKSKKAFTLIEILAIIILLGIIAIITIPQVNKTIKDSKKNAAKDSAYGYKNAVHQYYLTNITDDSSFDLNGTYTISDNNITNGVDIFNIPSTGSVPESGDIFIENGEIIEGCINYGKNSVVIEDGNVVDTIEGDCFNTSYFTYDENATEGSHGKITERQSQLNSSWKYYIKEKESKYSYAYNLYCNESDGTRYAVTENSNYSLAECKRFIPLEAENHNNNLEEYSCEKSSNKLKIYEVCGVENGETFCLKTNIDSYNASQKTLDTVFDNCSVIEQNNAESYECYGENASSMIGNGAYAEKDNSIITLVTGATEDIDSAEGCVVIRGYFDGNILPSTFYLCMDSEI